MGIFKLGFEAVHVSLLPIFYLDFSHHNIDLCTINVKRTRCCIQYYISVRLQTYLQMYFTSDFEKLVDLETSCKFLRGLSANRFKCT